MRLLAIDLGTRCGWCAYDDEVADRPVWLSGVWDLRGGRFDGGGMRYLRFRGLLAEALNGGIDRVAYEEVRRHLGVDASHVYGGLQGVLQEECERRRVPYEGIPVATIKRTATGKGNADKAAMVYAARLRWPGVPLADDNEADARWIAATVAGKVKR